MFRNKFVLSLMSLLISGSVFAQTICDYTGGRLEIFNSEAGEEIWVCKIFNQFVGDATYIRHLKKEPTLALDLFFNRKNQTMENEKIPNPSATYCAEMGGEYIKASREGKNIGFCKFKDDSMISSWTLFRGCEHEQKLCEFLKKVTFEF